MMKREHLLLCAFLSFAGICLADNRDAINFPKGQLLQAASQPARASLLPEPAISRTLYELNFDAASAGWTPAGTWQLQQIPAATGMQRVLVSTDEKLYQPDLDSRVTGPSLALPTIDPNASRLILTLHEQYEIESVYDHGYLEISTDAGASWLVVHGRSGKSEWRETQVDISQFSGETIHPAFRLHSDQSHEYAGWQIASMRIELQELNLLTASLVSLNAQNFPHIYMNVEVNSGSSTLSQNNFTVYENGVLQSDYFQVTPPQAGSGSRLSDIIFLMDNSGSMDDDQAAVYNNVSQFVDDLAASQVNYALGLCRFGMDAGAGDPVIANSGQLTTDTQYFKNSLWSTNVVDGSREPGYDAIVSSSRAFSFRPGAQKVFILITDERPNQGSNTEEEVRNVCTSGSITLFVLTVAELNSYFTSITSATNGAIYDIHANFNTILQYISSQVSSSYVVQYRTNKPVVDGVERRVEVRISWNGEQTSVFGSYIPGAVPQLTRTAATIALEQQAWAAGTLLTIEVEAVDLYAPYVTSVTLYCRTTGSGTYQAWSLNQVSGSLWRGQIPTGIVNSPGVDYYLTASDGVTTVSSPSVNPVDSPWQIAILPNIAPQITHTPVTQASRGYPVTVTIEAQDGTNRLAAVVLYYKRTGQLSYQSANFNYVSGITFRYSIPAEYVTVAGVDYFIKAWDDLGTSSTHGTFDQPHYISTGSSSFQPQLLDPLNGKVGMGAEVWLSWEASTGATSYRIEVDDNANFSSLDFSRSNVSETRIYVSGLDYNSKYYWRVQAKNSQSTSEWSLVFQFTTMSEPPVKVNYPGQYVLAWLESGDQCYADRNYVLGSVPAALRYNLYIKTSNADKNRTTTDYLSFTLTKEAIVYVCYDDRSTSPPDWLSSNFIRISKKIDVNELTGAITPYTIWKRTLQPGTHVLGANQAAGAAGARINFLVLFSFGFDPFTPLQIVSPRDSARFVPVNPTLFEWHKIPGALWYDFNLSTGKSSSKVIAYDYGLSDTTYKVSILQLGQTYYWRLRASSEDRTTEWTNWFTFTTGTPPTLTRIAISGSDEVKSNSSTDYICTAFFSDGSSQDVTRLTAWSTNSTLAIFVSAGHLVSSAVTTDQNLAITASYNGLTAVKGVKIRFVPIPVIFVPGIMGSPLYNDKNGDDRLSDTSPLPFGEQIWLNDLRIGIELAGMLYNNLPEQEFLLDLSLKPNGEAPLNAADNIKVAPVRGDPQNTLETNLSKLPLKKYQEFFDYFKARNYLLDRTAELQAPPGTNLFCFTYDWRKSIPWNGEKLSAFISQVMKWTNSSKVNIVAHSMGGLVTKSCVREFNPERIDKIIFIGTPHLGAPLMYYTMLTGDAELEFIKDLILNNLTVKQMTTNMPSTYQIFPSAQFYNTAITNGGGDAELYRQSLITIDQGPFVPDVEQALGYAEAISYFKNQHWLGNPAYNNSLLDLSTAIQNNLKTVNFGNIKVYNIVGTGIPTIGHIKVFSYLGLKYDHHPLYNLDGDGTVPLKSAETINGTASFASHTFHIPDVEHSNLPSNAAVLYIIEALLKGTSDPAPIPLAENYSYANEDSWQSIIACPVVVHVYDDYGRHTGPTSDSTWAEDIPGSHYIPVNLADPQSRKIFLLPCGGSYRYEISAQDTSGFFDFYTYEVIGGNVRALLAFDSVHFTPSTKAYCQIKPQIRTIDLRVDHNSDGRIDTTYTTAVNYPSGAGEEQKDEAVRDYSLFQNFPNPFNQETRIRFSLPHAGNVNLAIYNISGQKILTLLDQHLQAGYHEIPLKGSELATGVYLCQMIAGGYSKTIKIALLR